MTTSISSIWCVLRTLQTWIKVSLLTLLILLLYIIHHSYAYIKPPALIYIPKASIGKIINELDIQGVPMGILDYKLFKRYGVPKEGWIRFDKSAKLLHEEFVVQLLYKLREKTRRIVMYSGDTVEDFAAKTGKQTNLSSKKIIDAYHHYSAYLDGGIIAGYYNIPYRTTPSAIIYYMTYSSKQRLEELADSYNISKYNRILTIASIIQRETQNPKEMALISSVIHNRLKKNMMLQLDVTLNYGKYSHQIVTPSRIKSDKSHYNTYLHKGLPPHPIGSATKKAIIAAIKPTDTNYLYFMLNPKGKHDFSATYSMHLANIRHYRQVLKKRGKQ